MVRGLLIAGGVVRLILLFYGTWQDENMVVKYTDVDYWVYTDAARYVTNGESPYSRLTYRYTPLLAYALCPNIWLHVAFGKLVFVASDLMAGWIIYDIARARKLDKPLMWCATWVLHPLAINISTRGNADTLVCLLVLLTLHALMKKRLFTAALWYGFAVHLRLYPIVFGPSIMLFINDEYIGRRTGSHVVLQSLRERIKFGLVSGGLFLALGGWFTYLYGYDFLYETYLYHFVRTDNRHNFSIYFYDLYLNYERPSGFFRGLFAFIPLFTVQASISWVLHDNLVTCMCLQTMAFVAFNKVCTAQYFLWYTSLFPLVLPETSLELRWEGLGLMAIWFSAQLNWLWWAYRLEFLGENTFFQVWASSVAFFAANLYVIIKLVLAHRQRSPPPLFAKGNLQGLFATHKHE